MDSSSYRRPGAFSPLPSAQPQSRQQLPRPNSSGSDSSSSSQLTAMSGGAGKRAPYQQQLNPVRPGALSASSSNSSTASLHTFSRPSIAHVASDLPSRKNSPLNPTAHKRQHSQGFFEPSLRSASPADLSAMSSLTASQIAAQAAMQQQVLNQHIRRRSQTVPSPQLPPENNGGRMKPPPLQIAYSSGANSNGGNGVEQKYHNGLIGGHTAATSAANAAFPRTAQLSPGLTTFTSAVEKDPRSKTERAKMKLFSKPKHIGISGYRDSDKKDKALPSPNKVVSPGPSVLSKNNNVSTTSLADPPKSSASSMYSTNNASNSTLVPGERQRIDDKEKAHKHHFLSRQKLKLKDKLEDHSIALSSASSNSRPLDPNAPQSIYSFAPASPGPSSTSFAKSMSGLDLRHGGRALREKKKEERAAMPLFESKRSDMDKSSQQLSTSLGSTGHSFLGPSSTSNASMSGAPLTSHGGDLAYGNLQGFGLSNMTPEDAWDFLKAKLLIIFEGEELRMPIEDLNRLVSVHIQRCAVKRAPMVITEDLRDLLQTGFLSLEQTLRGIPDERLVPHLVDMWIFVFGTILPYMQAVFLPLDLEFKGHGTIMTSREAAEFWGFTPDPTEAFENALDVRRIVLLSYRDNVILPRHDALKAIFSRLSLESINVGLSLETPGPMGSPRPGTPGALDPSFASFNSQGSTLLDDASGARSRATSNTSAPELPSFALPLMAARRHVTAPPDSEQITETVGRMLQCVSVLGSVQSGDDAQMKMEKLARELKLNWLGRGRTGRNRKGFVGTRVPLRNAPGVERMESML
ncbi:hypothetical protein MMC17_007726 [Xylographa soralifera]|nr:hypothetical protein [Xylographa soralifera]